MYGGLLLRKPDTTTKQGASRVWLGNVLINLVFVIIYLLYPSTSAKIFATFQCKDVGDGTKYLRADLSIDCDSPAHVSMTAYAVLMIFIVPLGAPALYAYLLFRSYGTQLQRLKDIEVGRTNLQKEAASADNLDRWDKATGRASARTTARSDDVQPRLDALVVEEKALKAKLPGYIQTLSGSGYALRVFYFEIVESLRKLSIVCVPVFFASGTTGQLLFGLMICFVTFGSYTMLQPYKNPEDNTFAAMRQVIIFFSLVSSIFLKEAAPDSTAATVTDFALTSLFCAPILFEVWVYMGFSCQRVGCHIRRHRRQFLLKYSVKKVSTDTRTKTTSSRADSLAGIPFADPNPRMV